MQVPRLKIYRPKKRNRRQKIMKRVIEKNTMSARKFKRLKKRVLFELYSRCSKNLIWPL